MKSNNVAPVPPIPTIEDVKFAREQFIEILCDFPFVSDAERTHAVALLLQPFARELIAGPTPLFLIEKPAPGTGAGLLSDILIKIFLGRSPAVMAEGRDEDEWRKRITAKLIEHNDVLLIDNLQHRLDSASLSAALTCDVWEDRVLGRSSIVRVPVRATWVATGNNPALSNELARRIVRIRLDSKVDRPWLRNGFKHPDLREYVTRERDKLVWCALVLIQDWICNGRPDGGVVLGTFELWSKTLGGILANAGFEGFLSNLIELYEESDAEGKAWRTLVGAWWETHADDAVGVSDLYSIVCPAGADPLDLDLGDKTEKSQKTKLGILLRRNRDRQFDGKKIVAAGQKSRAQLWRLESVGE